MKNYRLSILSVVALCCALMFLTSCEMAKNSMQFDRSAGKEQQDYRRALAPRPLPEDDMAGDSMPLESYIAEDVVEKTVFPLVSVSVNQTVSLRDLLFELSEQAGVDLEMDPQIRGTLIFTVRNRPFDEVIERITAMAGLRYTLDQNLLRVELDRPYVKNYELNYLNVIRKVKSSIDLDASVISEDEATVGSSSSIESDLETDFWTSLDANLSQILTSSENPITLATLADPAAQPRATPQAESVSITDMSQLPPPILDVRAPPASSDPALPNPASSYSVNRQAGIISVFTTQRQHKLIEKYLADLKKSATTQILIEAKILEVTLNDEFNTGINWDAFFRHDLTGLIDFGANFPRPGLTSQPADAFNIGVRLGSDIAVLVDAMNQFGTVRALSSPRLTVLNNQSAILNVIENEVFFEFDFTRETDPNTGAVSTDVSTEIRAVPIGIMMNVNPSVNFRTGEITMMLRPTAVAKSGPGVVDPSIRLALAGADAATIAALGNIPDNLIPELSVQEVDSVIKLQSGEVVVMGGLMTDKNAVTRTGVPILGNMPVVGKLFSSQSDLIEKNELVIFIRATILPGSDSIHDYDKELYKEFGQDRRPVKM